MFDFSKLKHTISNYFTLVKRRYWLALAIVLLLLVFLMRSCSSSHLVKPIYVIGHDSQWSGVHVMNKNRELSAFNLDLLTAIAREEGTRFRLQPLPPTLLMRRLENGELDAILSNLSPTPINQSLYSFSEPYFPLGPVLIISAKNPLKGWNEKAIKLIGIQPNSSYQLNLDKDPTIQLRLYDNILNALSDLDDRRIDGVIFPAIPAYIYTQTFYEGKLKIATSPLTNESLRLVTLKTENGEELVKLFNDGLKNIQANQTYHKLLNQWGFLDIEKMGQMP
jgi:polar amino acid transport system substrate-binding protein